MKVLFLAVLAVGCGIAPEAPESEVAPQQDALRVRVAEAQLTRPRALQHAALERGAKPLNEVTVRVNGGTEGEKLKAIFGQMSCGFLELGRGEATVTGGHAVLGFSTPEALWGITALVFRDLDHDGQCNPTHDQVFEVSSYGAPNAPLTLDLATAETSAWACYFFGSGAVTIDP